MTVIGALSSFRKRGEMSLHKRAYRHQLPNCRQTGSHPPLTAGFVLLSRLMGGDTICAELTNQDHAGYGPFSEWCELLSHAILGLGAGLGATRKGKWLRIPCKRHQIGHLDFRPPRLLTEGLLVRI